MTPSGVLAAPGAAVGQRRTGKDRTIDRSPPPWRSWRTRSRAARAIRWIEEYVRVPSGVGAGEPIRLARFQRDELARVLDGGVRQGGIQIPRGNAKSTLWAAVGLWAVCDPPDAPQVPLVAYNALQAGRTLMRPIRRMVSLNPELDARCVVYTSNNERRVWSGWNDGELLPLAADVERLQGLNPTVALVDEAQTVEPAVLRALLQGAGKRAESLVLVIGTPAPGAQSSALFDFRTRAETTDAIAWVEYAATAGCALDDRTEWHRANPAIRAGFLFDDVLVDELQTVDEVSFRCYRLGQWLDVVDVSWLPPGAWEDCPHADPPDRGVEVVLGLAGTWTSTLALVGATLDGAIFLAWWAETATDDELDDVLAGAYERWTVRELVVQPRTRSGRPPATTSRSRRRPISGGRSSTGASPMTTTRS
jgi:phage terminase large subunit-like protein